jgi:5-methylcytosine-specific restriction endonuclease McrA
MASRKRCLLCEKPFRRSKNRAFGTVFCSDRCRWEADSVPIDLIYERDNGVCHLCDRVVPRLEASRDHVKPRSEGGKTNFENIKLAHTSCNSRRGSRPVAEFRALLERQLAATSVVLQSA